MNSNYQAQFYSVCADDYQGAYEGTRELFRMGHRKIAYFDCLRQDLPQLLTDRYFGFHKAIVEYGIEFDDSLKIRVEVGNVTALTEQLKTLLRDNPDITGIFALDDELASWIVAVLSHLGKRIPVDISIIAPGDVLEYGLPYVPQISTMRIDTGYMGKIAAQMILSRMTQNPEGIHVLKVKEQLMNRGSIGVGPAGLSEE